MQKIKVRLPAIFLLAFSLLFWGNYDRYEAAGPVLLEAPSLADATRLWGQCSETNSHFVLTVPGEGKTASINFRIPGASAYDRIRVSGRIKVDGVETGKYRWSCARLLLSQYDKNEKWIPGHHSLKAQSGTRDWVRYEQEFEIMPETARADLVIQQIGKAGRAEFDQLMAVPVRLRASFIVWWVVFSGAWVFMGVLFFRRCRLDRRRLRVLILLNAIAILTGTLMPGKWIENTSQYLKDTVVKTAAPAHQQPANASEQPVRELRVANQFNHLVGRMHRLGHFLLFASLCFLVYLSAALEGQHRSYFFKVAFDLLIFAMITESLQYLTLDRTPGVTDWLTDVYGIFVALALFAAVRRLVPVSGQAKCV